MFQKQVPSRACVWESGFVKKRNILIMSMLRRFLKTMVLMGLCLGLAAATPGSAKTPPKMTLEETSYDFGTHLEGQPLSHTFVIENRGGEPLKIEGVDATCVCTVPQYTKSIPPGAKGEVTLTIKPFSVLNKFRKQAVVHTNDPEHPEVSLVLMGVVQPLIEVQPGRIVRFLGDPREEKRSEVRFISHLSTPWEIKDFRTNIPDKIEVSLKAEEPGKIYVLEVKNRLKEGGRYAGMIEVFTSFQERPQMIIRVFANLSQSPAKTVNR
jgi:hypothetical protein